MLVSLMILRRIGGKLLPEPMMTQFTHTYIVRKLAYRMYTWWRHQMETFSVLQAICVRGIDLWIPRTKASNAEL